MAKNGSAKGHISDASDRVEPAPTVRSSASLEHRVLVLAPFGQDAYVVCRVLAAAGVEARTCATVEEVCVEIKQGAAAAVLAEEAVSREGRLIIAATLTSQPAWSDFPLLLLMSNREQGRDGGHAPWSIEGSAYVALLDRPLRTVTFTSALRVAIRSRQRQYQVRDELAARKRAEEELRNWNDKLEQRVAERTSALTMLCDVGMMANSATDVEAALAYVLKRVSEHNGWSCGHAWLPAAGNGSDELLPGYAWYEEAPARFDDLQKLISAIRLRPREGLVGRVFASGEPEFTNDIGLHLSVYQAPLAEHAGIQTACAFPILVGKRIVGVLEFLSEKLITPTEQRLVMMASVGTLLGRVIEREQAARELKAREDRFRSFMDNSPTIAWMKDEKGRYVYLSRSYERHFNVRFADWRGKTDFELWPPEIAEQFRKNDLAVMREARVVEAVERAPKPDGTIGFWWDFKFPFEDAHGRRYVGGVGLDITKEKQSEEALRKSEARLELALAASELGFWDINLATGEMIVDERWTAMLGYAEADIASRADAWEALIHPHDVGRVRRARSDHLEGRTTYYRVEHRLLTRSGQWKWIRSRGRVTEWDENRQPLRLIGTHRDVTERKMLEREVVETAAEEQRRIGRELHDGIGGELTGIGFTVQGLIEDLQRSAARAETATAKKIGEELDRVIEQVRLLSHGLNPVEVDGQGLVVALEQLASRTRHLYRIPCEFRSNGPVEIEDTFVADHLYRIAQEAVTNAVNHGAPQHIWLTLESEDGIRVLRVTDDGVGIETEGNRSDGIGLRNMRYRAGLIGADFRIEAGNQGGTLVECRFTSDRLG